MTYIWDGKDWRRDVESKSKPKPCICHGVTLTMKQWMIVRTFMSFRYPEDGRELAIQDCSSPARLTLKRPGANEIPCSEDEFEDLCAKLDRGPPVGSTGGVHWCPRHDTHVIPVVDVPMIEVVELRIWSHWPSGSPQPRIDRQGKPAGGPLRIPFEQFEALQRKGLAGLEPKVWMCVKDTAQC